MKIHVNEAYCHKCVTDERICITNLVLFHPSLVVGCARASLPMEDNAILIPLFLHEVHDLNGFGKFARRYGDTDSLIH